MRQHRNYFEELEKRSRPAMCDQQRERILPLTEFVYEVNLEAVHIFFEVGEPVHSLFLAPPIKLRQPVFTKLLHVLEIGSVGPS